jgi:uncharacterized protein YggU (UPF0235/DUF167 family)
LIFEVEVEFHKDFVKVEGDKITIGLQARPVGGRANSEMIKKLARHFNVSTSQIRIMSGLRTKRKVVEILC